MKSNRYSKNYDRPPTRLMIEKLRYCLEKEENQKNPCLAEEMKSSLAGLYKRGFIDTRMEMVNDKKLLCIYVTDTGRDFLNSLKDAHFPDFEDN